MINSLTIKNFALIKDLNLDFEKGFNVLVGETGAGKSIILSAIQFALGSKIDKSIIGNNIKYLRNKNDLTQYDLAKILNTSQSTISAYENGKTLVLTAFIFSLAKEFNLSIDKLCGLEKTKVNINL